MSDVLTRVLLDRVMTELGAETSRASCDICGRTTGLPKRPPMFCVGCLPHVVVTP